MSTVTTMERKAHSGNLALSCAVCLVLGGAPVFDASANGGPAALAPLYGVSGGLIALRESDIELVSERLRISLLSAAGPDALWRAKAEYELANRGPARAVRFAVPIRLPYSNLRYSDTPQDPLYEARMGASAIKIGVDGKVGGCSLEVDRMADGDFAVGQSGHVEGWCVATLRLPKGASIPVTLEYVQEMFAVRGGPGGNEQWRLRYPLWPAGFWKGPVRVLDAVVDLGDYSGLATVVSPPDGVLSGSLVSWRLENADLKAVNEIVLDVAKYPRSDHKRLCEECWARRDAALTAESSSTLAPQGRFRFAAENAVDGSPATAWCEGVKGNGVGESLKVSWRVKDPPPESQCEVRDVVLLPGYSRDASSYQGNGRVQKVRIGRCDSPGGAFEAAVLPGDSNVENGQTFVWPMSRVDTWLEPPQEIRVPEGALPGKQGCVEMTILSVKPGSKFQDTCVSEFAPRVYCRKVAPARP